jgi:hypothetical protein
MTSPSKRNKPVVARDRIAVVLGRVSRRLVLCGTHFKAAVIGSIWYIVGMANKPMAPKNAVRDSSSGDKVKPVAPNKVKAGTAPKPNPGSNAGPTAKPGVSDHKSRS